jgi:hypothetical protein
MRMAGFQQRYAQGILGLVALTAGTLGGLRLSRWLAGGPAGGGPIDARFAATPDPGVTSVWTGLFDAARSEIWLAAGRLESERVLEALESAARRGVAVHLTLSPTQNPDPDAGARGWLRFKTSVRDVRLSRHGFNGAACVVDGTRAVVTAEDLLPESAAAADAGVFFCAANPDIGSRLRTRLADQHLEGTAEAAAP